MNILHLCQVYLLHIEHVIETELVIFTLLLPVYCQSVVFGAKSLEYHDQTTFLWPSLYRLGTNSMKHGFEHFVHHCVCISCSGYVFIESLSPLFRSFSCCVAIRKAERNKNTDLREIFKC
jgi:hypothetical protein